MAVPRIDRSKIGILLIDVQPFFVDGAFADRSEERESLMVRLEHLLMFSDWMELPFIATFEKPVAENGELPDNLEALFPAHGERHVKNYFGCASEPQIREAIEQSSVKQIAVAGSETDVCVLQSTLGLLELGYEVFLLEDCLFTTESEPGPALQRMHEAGAVPTTLKTMLYELVECVDQIPWYEGGLPASSGGDMKPFPEAFIAPEEWPPRRPPSSMSPRTA
ncbi:MAG: isochorismatase family protein [Actinomycetota bacterium]